eukprot:GFUD01005275.1.p1 GENE.GFUD01005275.1~~GFUD01005275.1.p1  ORF type:complete len:623 (-),score=158.43 GFUD01005275.1:144-2012(-)
MNHIWHASFVFGFLRMSLGMSLFGDDPVKVNFCCPDGEKLRLHMRRDILLAYHSYVQEADCVWGDKNNLEGMEVSVLHLTENNETEFVKRKLSKLHTKMPKCGRGLRISKPNFNQTNGNGTKQSNTNQSQTFPSIELRKNNESVPNASEGNVYIDGKPVCDDGWDKKAARVACRMLGFDDGEETQESQYGTVGDNMAMDDVRCKGDESTLYECGYSSYDDCDGGEGAGVVCSKTDDTVSLDLSGKLIQLAQEVDTEHYCLAFKIREFYGYWYSSESSESSDEIVTLSCDQCMEEVMCYYVRLLFEALSGKGGITVRNLNGEKDHPSFIRNGVLRIADKNRDGEVQFDEFHSKFVEYLTILFNLLDRNNDGSIDEVLTNEAIKEYSLEFFEQILKNAVEYFDSNGDKSISTDDFISVLRFNDRNEDGEVTIYELIGTSLINLPAPLYTAYTLLDEDQDEKLTVDEMLGFLRRTFTIIDKNGDCNINFEEIVTALGASNLKEDFQLGIKLIGQQYITLAKYFVDGFIAKADKNKDTKVTLEEIIKFADFSFIDRSIQIAPSMGYPNGPAFLYLTGGYERGYGPSNSWREQRERIVVVWLTTLNTFLNNPVYQSTPSTQCGLSGQ